MEKILRNLGVDVDFNFFLPVVLLGLARIIPILILNPLLGGSVLQTRIVMGIALAFMFALYPLISANVAAPPPTESIPFLLMLIKELLVGASIGYVSSLVFYGIETAGRILDMQRGANLAEVLAPQLQAQVSFLGQLQLQIAIVVFLVLNGHHIFLRAVFRSFEVFPITQYPHFSAGFTSAVLDLTRMTGNVFVIALQLSAPALIALFIVDIVFGILNRIAPQVQVFFLSQPVKMGVGLLVVFFILSFLITQMGWHFADMTKAAREWITKF